MTMRSWTKWLFGKRAIPASTGNIPPESQLREYLYLDERRLNAYVQQVHAPVTWDKIPLWSVELSVAGPKASGQQARPARPLTNHEKTQILVDYLKSTNEYARGRPMDPTIYSVGP